MSPNEIEALKARIREQVHAELSAQHQQRMEALLAELAKERESGQRRRAELERHRDELQHLAATLGGSVGFWFWRAPAELNLSAPIRRLLPGSTGVQRIEDLLLPRVHPQARAGLAAALAALAGGTLRYLTEEFNLEAEPERWLQLRGRLVASTSNGQAAALSGTLADISERKRLEARRQEAERLLMQGERADSLALLAGGVAHDLNELLQTLIGNAELALDEVPAQSAVAEYLSNVSRVGRQAGEVCAQLLAYSGHGRYVMQPLDLNALLHNNVEQLSQVARRHRVKLRLETDPEERVADGDPGQLRQMLVNLLRNACEASQPGELVHLRVRKVDIQPDSPAPALWPPGSAMPGRYVCLEVEDHGYGMDEATRTRMFEPFFSTKFTGRGLGLAATAGIVRSHGGMFEVHSVQGQGTRIAVLLPQSWQLAEPLPGLAPIPARQRFRGRLLVVDDHPEVRDIASRMLGRLGFQVYAADSGEQALKQVEAQQGRLDLVMMDLVMPGMGGEQACRELKRRYPELKVLLMTGYYDRMLRETWSEQGFDGLLGKPFHTRELVQAIGAVLGGSTLEVPD